MSAGKVPLLLCLAAILGTPAPVRAAAGDFEVRLGAELRYDDNVFEYGDADRELFDPALDRYRGLGSVDDWIVVPQARAEYRWRGTYDTRLALAGSWAFYESNHVKDYQSYSLRLSRELPGDADLTLRYALVPRFFFKRLADPPNQLKTYADATYRIHTLRAALDKRISGRVGLEAWGELGRNDYNHDFDERDITKLGGGVGISVDAAAWLRLSAGAGLEEGVSRGENDPATNSDTSYTLWTAELSALVRISDRLTLTARYFREGENYTTGLIHDRSHFERDDVKDVFEIGARARLGRRTTIAAGVEYTDNRADRDGERLGFASFTDTVCTAQVAYEF